MARRITAQLAQNQFPELLDEAIRGHERILVERDGEPAVVILSVQDYLENTANAPAWLSEAWAGARERGVDKLTMDEINEEIAIYRREKRASATR
jgi:prevent-host-death family protein